MPLAEADLRTRAWRKFNLTVTTGNDITTATACRIMAISITPAAATTTLVLANAATVTGTDLIHLQALASGPTVYVDFSPNGVRYGTGISYTLAGAGAFGEVYAILE